MKRLLALTLALLMLTGCGASPDSVPDSQGDGSESVSENANGTADNSSDGIDVDKGLLEVEFTVPAEFFDEGTTQESLDEAVNEEGFKSATLNDEGSVSYVMTRAKHAEMMDDIREEIDSSLAEMVGSEEYPTITKIEPNSTYTEFKVYLSTEEVGLAESFSALALYVFGGMYNAFNGEPVDDVAVFFVSESTDEVIQESHSKDLGSTQ